MSSDAPDLPFVPDKKTVELCADELYKTVRCSLPRGHDGNHVFQAVASAGTITWKQRAE
jgi:hypothetical protein